MRRQRIKRASSSDGFRTELSPSEVIARYYEDRNKARQELTEFFTSRLLRYTELLDGAWRVRFEEDVASFSSLLTSGVLGGRALDFEHRLPIVRNSRNRMILSAIVSGCSVQSTESSKTSVLVRGTLTNRTAFLRLTWSLEAHGVWTTQDRLQLGQVEGSMVPPMIKVALLMAL